MELTINFRIKTNLEAMCKEKTYKNIFEVMNLEHRLQNYIELRKTCEDKLFSGIYNDAQPNERVKYGACNIFNDSKGALDIAQYGEHYGDSFFVLKNHVKSRVTIVYNDSFIATTKQIATFDNLSHILLNYDDKTLHTLIELAIMGTTVNYTTFSKAIYTEFQVHGDLTFATDIDRMMVNPIHKTNKAICDLLEEFTVKHGVKYDWYT